MTPKVRTCLWFDGTGEEAARFYCGLIPDSRIDSLFRPDPAKPALLVNFTLGGTPYQALDAGPAHKLSPAVSISVTTQDQAETDRLWTALLAGGGAEMACAWLTDRFGLCWQIVPRRLPELLMDPDPAVSARVMQAMMGMVKIDVAAIERAAAGP